MFRHLIHTFCILLFSALVRAAPKILIASDSTAADYSISSVLQGWGTYLGDYMTIRVVNKAKNGRSTRSFIAEGLWTQLLAMTAPGDFVVIEMGHNDANDPRNANVSRGSRGVLPGTGDGTIIATGSKGQSEIVHTFGWYLRKMIDDTREKSCIPLISGMVPRNSWRNNAFSNNWPMANDAQTVARQKGIEYIDHTRYTVLRFQALGEKGVKAYFPKDSTHTNEAGARVNAETFVTALKCAKSKASSYISSRGNALEQKC